MDDQHLIAMLAACVARLKEIKREIAGSDDTILRFHVETAARAAEHALSRLTSSDRKVGNAAADHKGPETQADCVGGGPTSRSAQCP